MEIVTLLPFINLAMDLFTSSAEPVTTGDLLYDVAQFLAGLVALSKLGAWLATFTETKKDDRFWAKAGNLLGKAIEKVSDLAAARGAK